MSKNYLGHEWFVDSIQLYPLAHAADKEKYLINDFKELIEELESLRHEAALMIQARFTEPEPVFYRDFNALGIIINLLIEKEKDNE